MSKATAESALMDRLEVWATSLGDGGIKQADGARYYPTHACPDYARRMPRAACSTT
jgi:hypothetical protein